MSIQFKILFLEDFHESGTENSSLCDIFEKKNKKMFPYEFHPSKQFWSNYLSE